MLEPGGAVPARYNFWGLEIVLMPLPPTHTLCFVVRVDYKITQFKHYMLITIKYMRNSLFETGGARSVRRRQGRTCNYHWGRRGSCLDWFSQKKNQTNKNKNKNKEREREKERKRAEDKISISALLKVIFGMWCVSVFIFVFDVGCFSGLFFFCSLSDVGSFITDFPPY